MRKIIFFLFIFFLSIFFFQPSFEYTQFEYSQTSLKRVSYRQLKTLSKSYSFLHTLKNITHEQIEFTFFNFMSKHGPCPSHGLHIIINDHIYVRPGYNHFEPHLSFQSQFFYDRRIRNTFQWLFALKKLNKLPNHIEFLLNLDDSILFRCPNLKIVPQCPILSWSSDIYPSILPFLPMGFDYFKSPLFLPKFHQRKNIFFWRGSNTNLLRENLVLSTLAAPHIDARYSSYKNRTFNSLNHTFLKKNHLINKKIPRSSFSQYKFIIDIDGHGWSSRFPSLLGLGSIVLKYQTQHAEFFYPLLKQNENIIWIHNHSHLLQETQRLLNNSTLCEIIAENTKSLFSQLTKDLALHYASNLLLTLKAKLLTVPIPNKHFYRVYNIWNQPIVF